MQKIKEKYKAINQNYDGVELCSCCGRETNFIFNPVTNRHIKCEHCGEIQMPCSLCDAHNCNAKCLTNIREELMRCNDVDCF